MLLNNWRFVKYIYLLEYSNNVWLGYRRFWGVLWLWGRMVFLSGWGRGEVVFFGGILGSGRRVLWLVGIFFFLVGSWIFYVIKIIIDLIKYRVYIIYWKYYFEGLWWKWVNKSLIEIKCF